MADIVVTARTLGADHAAGTMNRIANEARDAMLRGMRGAQDEMEGTFADRAPYDQEDRDDYHMRDHISTTVEDVGRAEMTVYVEAISPESGYNYLGVTRFGHKGPILPKAKTWLKWESGGKTHFAKETKGHHPAGDWVERAHEDARRAFDDIRDRVGREISTVIHS